MTGNEIIEKLKLEAHPEGGFYKETYRADLLIKTDQLQTRNVSTAIYFLLKEDEKSLFHRIKSDELWFFHQGEPLEIVFIENNELRTLILGNDIANGEVTQAMIPANIWFGSRVKNAIGYSLVSCTVAPGFDFLDFELANRETLTTEFPHLKEVIRTFTKNKNSTS